MSAGRDARDGEGGFLGRWSERKLKARTEPEPEVAAEEAPETELPAEPVAPKSEAEVLEELGLPDPDTLVKGDDFSGFMKKAVPAALRNRALRRLWLTDPVLANLDGLNDYEQDFTDAATVVPNLKTAYRVGRGYLRDEPVADEPAPETVADASGQSAGAEEPADGARPDDVQADGAQANGEQAEAGGAEHGQADGADLLEGGQAGADAAGSGQGAAEDSSEQVDEPIERAGADEAPDGALRPRRMRFLFDS